MIVLSMNVPQVPLPEQFHPLDQQELKLSMWWLDHEGKIKVWLRLAIIIACCGVVAFSIGVWTRYVMAERAMARQLMRPGLPYSQWKQSHPIADLVIDDVTFIKAPVGSQAVWSAMNQNNDYVGVVSFALVSAPDAHGLSAIRIYPGQKQWLSAFVPSSVTQIDASELTVDVEWVRVKGEVGVLLSNLSDVSVKEVVYIPETGVALPAVRAVIENSAVAGYWKARLAVVGFEAGTVAGFTDISIDALQPLEQRTEAFAWRGPALSSSATLEAAVYLDVWDEDLNMKSESPNRVEF